jgi:hypoxanthine phosphoribosyltransferase
MSIQTDKKEITFKELTIRLQKFNPGSVVYVATGGRKAGEIISTSLDIPLYSIDIRYPYSRYIEKIPQILRPFLWIFKELLYRFSSPSQTGLPDSRIKAPVILTDDRAGSGKTLVLALNALKKLDIDRKQIYLVVTRCGRRSIHLVDSIAKLP